MRRCLVHTLSALLLVATGCGDSDSEPAAKDTTVAPDTTVSDTSAGDTIVGDSDAADTSADTDQPTLESASFKFVGSQGEDLGQFAVNWTPPGGETRFLMTGEDGAITFEGIDWSKGTATLVGFRDNRVIRGVVMNKPSEDEGFSSDDEGNWLIFTAKFAPSFDQVTISGKAAAMIDAEDHTLEVYPDAAEEATASIRLGDDYSFRVPRSTPFNWCALETSQDSVGLGKVDVTIHQVACGSHPGADELVSLELDFSAQSLATKTASGTFPIFSDEISRLDDEGTPRVVVFAHAPARGVVGFQTESIKGAGGDGEYTVEWAEPEWATGFVTRFTMGTNREFSNVFVDGVPTDGSQDITLMVPPTFLAPSTSAPYPANAGLVWTEGAADTLPGVAFFGGDDNTLVAAFNLPRGTTEFTLPALPLGIDPFRETGWSQLGVRATSCDIDRDFGPFGACRRFAIGQAANLEAPETVNIEVRVVDFSTDAGLGGVRVCVVDAACATTGGMGTAVVSVPRGGDFTLDVDADGFFPSRFNRRGADAYQGYTAPVLLPLETYLGNIATPADAARGHIVFGTSGGGVGLTLSTSPSSGEIFYNDADGNLQQDALSLTHSGGGILNVEPGEYTVALTQPTSGSCEFEDAGWLGDEATVVRATVAAGRATFLPTIACNE